MCAPATAVAIPTGQNVNPTAPGKDWYQRTSFPSFGPWGPTSSCKQDCGPTANGGWSCKATGRWPYGMCTLKVLKDPAKPEFWNKNQGMCWLLLDIIYLVGWSISGAMQLLAGCCLQSYWRVVQFSRRPMLMPPLIAIPMTAGREQ